MVGVIFVGKHTKNSSLMALVFYMYIVAQKGPLPELFIDKLLPGGQI